VVKRNKVLWALVCSVGKNSLCAVCLCCVYLCATIPSTIEKLARSPSCVRVCNQKEFVRGRRSFLIGSNKEGSWEEAK
jgi:hypothetical protein